MRINAEFNQRVVISPDEYQWAQVRPGVMGRVQALEPDSLALADNGGDLKVQRGTR